MSTHGNPPALLGVTKSGFYHRKHPAHLKRHRQVDHAFLAPTGSNSVAMFVVISESSYHRVSKPEPEDGRAVHRAQVAAQHRLDLVVRHPRFQCHIDGKLGAGTAILGEGADDFGRETGFDRNHLAMAGSLRYAHELEKRGRRLLEHHFKITRVVTIALACR